MEIGPLISVEQNFYQSLPSRAISLQVIIPVGAQALKQQRCNFISTSLRCCFNFKCLLGSFSISLIYVFFIFFFHTCREEKEQGSLRVPLSAQVRRTASMTGVSEVTVSRVSYQEDSTAEATTWQGVVGWCDGAG